MKKILTLCTIIIGFNLFAGTVFAQGEANGQPFKTLSDSISSLQSRIETIENNFTPVEGLEKRLNGLEESFNDFASSVKDFMTSVDDRLFLVATSLGSLSDNVENLKKENQDTKQQLAAITDYINADNNSGGESKKTVYTGTVPNSLSGDDIIDLNATEVDGQTVYYRHYYYKKIAIPEMDLDKSTEIHLYSKINKSEATVLGDDVWRIYDDLLYFKNGYVLIHYASMDQEGPWYELTAGSDYKIVVSN